MGIRTHSCDVIRGEDLEMSNSWNFPVDIGDQSTLYSGRVFRVNAAGKAIRGGTGGSSLYIAKRGVDTTDVACIRAIDSSSTGGIGHGYISSVALVPGIGILTTEYTGTAPSLGALMEIGTASGEWRALNKGVALARVLEAPKSINGRNQVKLIIVSAGAAKTK